MQKVLAIVGPTAVGKTELAIKLAKIEWGNRIWRFHAGLSRS